MKRGHVPVRLCRACGCRRSKDELLRFVMRQGQLEERSSGTGRAVYCCPTQVCRQRLLKNKKVLKRAFRI
jgi:predicted RNA-binding protein YlxR (DUF448 family)